MSGRAEQTTKKKKKSKTSDKESSLVEKKKKKLGFKDLIDTPKTRADALKKLGSKADGWIGFNTGNGWMFKDPNGRSARGVPNAMKLLNASLTGSVQNGGFAGLEDNQDTRAYARKVIDEDATEWFGYSDFSGTVYLRGPGGLKTTSIDQAQALFKASKVEEVKLKSLSSVDMLDSFQSDIVDLESSIQDKRRLLDENTSSRDHGKERLLQREKDKLAAKMEVVMKVLSSEVKSNEQALEIITNLDGAYKQLHSYAHNKLLGPKKEFESEYTYTVRSEQRNAEFTSGGMSKIYHSSLRNDIRLGFLSLQTHLPHNIQETSTFRYLLQEVSNAEEELAKRIATKDDMYESQKAKKRAYTIETHNERKTSYEEASAAYYAAKEDKSYDKEKLQTLKKEMIDAGKDELRRNNGIRYQPKKLCLDDATDMLNLMDRFTFNS